MHRRKGEEQAPNPTIGCLDGPNPSEPEGLLLNDAQSRLNPTRVHSLHRPRSLEDLREHCIRRERLIARSVSRAGATPWVASSSAGTTSTWT